MSAINIVVSQGSKDLKKLQTSIEKNSLENLLEAIKEAKETSNSFLTELVNLQKSSSNTRKIDEIVSSDEEVDESSKKQKL